jgi:hypothetical protein
VSLLNSGFSKDSYPEPGKKKLLRIKDQLYVRGKDGKLRLVAATRNRGKYRNGGDR